MSDHISRAGGSFDRDSRSPAASPGLDADNLYRSESGNAGANLSRSNSSDIHFGYILDAIPFWGAYTVSVSGRPNYLCNDGTGLGGSPYYGVRGHKAIPPGTSVVIAAFPASQLGTIIAVVPEMTAGGRLTPMSGYVFMGSGPVGMASPLYDHVSNHPEAAGAIDFDAGAPVDQLPGDQACLSPLDVGWFVSMSMMAIRAQDDCAVELYHFDSLLRLHGHNFELFTGVGESRDYDDEGEMHSVRHYAKFPYEATGTTAPADPFREGEEGEDSFEAPKEPKEDAQTGAWRMMEAMGYLGDLKRAQIQRPSDKFKEKPATFGGFAADDGTAPVALSDIYEGSDGTLAFSSAKQIIFRKTPAIPAIVQNRLPDDGKDGDGSGNYKASGQFGDGEDPTESKEFEWDEDMPAGSRVEFLGDYLAHFFMWYSLLTFRDHKKDWVVGEVPANSEGFEGVDAGINKDAIEQLKTSFWGGMPTMKKVNVDAIKGEVSFFAGTSVHALLDDGSVYTEDAWGSSIFMGYGNIFIRPVGNLFIQTGQRTVVWNGLDHIVRSRGCVDVTATHGDLRAAVGRNIQILAGADAEKNGGTGGILFESRATTKAKDFNAIGEATKDSGITMVARKSAVSAYGDDIYLGTSGETNNKSPGIVLDASRGGRGIYETGGTVIRKSDKDFLDVFGDNINYIGPQLHYTQSEATIVEGTLSVVSGKGGMGHIVADGRIVTQDAMFAKKDIVSAYGSLAGESVFGKKGVAYYNPGGSPTMVAASKTDPLETFKKHMDAMKSDAAKKQIEDAKKNMIKIGEQTEEAIRQDQHPGGDKLFKNIGASLRTTEDYNVGDFLIAETSWQTRMSDDLTEWKEMAVKSHGGTGIETYPFPGMTFYIADYALYAGGGELIDPETGNPVPAGEAYEGAGAKVSDERSGLNKYKVFPSKYDD